MLEEMNSVPEPEPVYDEEEYEATLTNSEEDGLGGLGKKKDPDGDELLDAHHYAYYYDDSEEDVSFSAGIVEPTIFGQAELSQSGNGEDIKGLDVPEVDPSAGNT